MLEYFSKPKWSFLYKNHSMCIVLINIFLYLIYGLSSQDLKSFPSKNNVGSDIELFRLKSETLHSTIWNSEFPTRRCPLGVVGADGYFLLDKSVSEGSEVVTSFHEGVSRTSEASSITSSLSGVFRWSDISRTLAKARAWFPEVWDGFKQDSGAAIRWFSIGVSTDTSVFAGSSIVSSCESEVSPEISGLTSETATAPPGRLLKPCGLAILGWEKAAGVMEKNCGAGLAMIGSSKSCAIRCSLIWRNEVRLRCRRCFADIQRT